MRRKGQNSAYYGTEKLILNALSKILREKSSIQVKVKEVSETAGIAMSSFYLHYSSLDEVISKNEQKIADYVNHVVEIELSKNSPAIDSISKILYYLYRHRDYLDVIGYSCNFRFAIKVISCLAPLLERSWPNYPVPIKSRLSNLLIMECCAELNLWWKEGFSFNTIKTHAKNLVYISTATPKIYASMYANA